MELNNNQDTQDIYSKPQTVSDRASPIEKLENVKQRDTYHNFETAKSFIGQNSIDTVSVKKAINIFTGKDTTTPDEAFEQYKNNVNNKRDEIEQRYKNIYGDIGDEAKDEFEDRVINTLTAKNNFNMTNFINMWTNVNPKNGNSFYAGYEIGNVQDAMYGYLKRNLGGKSESEINSFLQNNSWAFQMYNNLQQNLGKNTQGIWGSIGGGLGGVASQVTPFEGAVEYFTKGSNEKLEKIISRVGTAGLIGGGVALAIFGAPALATAAVSSALLLPAYRVSKNRSYVDGFMRLHQLKNNITPNDLRTIDVASVKAGIYGLATESIITFLSAGMGGTLGSVLGKFGGKGGAVAGKLIGKTIGNTGKFSFSKGANMLISGLSKYPSAIMDVTARLIVDGTSEYVGSLAQENEIRKGYTKALLSSEKEDINKEAVLHGRFVTIKTMQELFDKDMKFLDKSKVAPYSLAQQVPVVQTFMMGALLGGLLEAQGSLVHKLASLRKPILQTTKRIMAEDPNIPQENQKLLQNEIDVITNESLGDEAQSGLGATISEMGKIDKNIEKYC